MALIRILDRPIAFHRCLVTITGSINAALLLSQAIYWSNRTSNPEGWFHKSMEEWEDEAGLTRHEQSKARELLRKTGFWEERKAGSPPQVYYRINPEKFDRVIASFEEINLPKTGKSIYRKPANQFAENRQINLPKTGKSICRKPAVNLPETGSQFAGNRQNLFIETEITTEITAERETRAQSAPFDSVEETAPDYKPNLDDIEVALCQAVGWITDLLDPSQYSGIRTAAKSLRAQPTVISAPASLTVERIGRAREFYQSQKKFSFAPSWIARDWAGLLAWIEAGNAGAKSGAAGLEAARAAMLASEAERARRRGTR